MEIYDVIVVYSENMANSVVDNEYVENAPFSSNSSYGIYNDSYRYFLSECEKVGIKACFATSKDIIGPGMVQGFWTYNEVWRRDERTAYSEIIFDKFTGSVEQKNKLIKLTSSESIHTFTDKKLFDVFQNKINTYRCFKDFTVPTVKLENLSEDEIILTKKRLNNLLKNHKNQIDFDNGFIIKDRVGSGGNKIFKLNFDKKNLAKIKKQYEADLKSEESTEYIMQPFIDCANGFDFAGHHGFIDLRIILLDHTIIQSYIRIAKKGDFKCNEHQGGNLIYIPEEMIPEEIIALTKKIVKKIPLKLNHSVYALDFIKSIAGNTYFIEGNNHPGIDWNHEKKENEEKTKELIKIIVKELKQMIKENQPISASLYSYSYAES